MSRFCSAVAALGFVLLLAPPSPGAEPPPGMTVYRLDLRAHLGGSGRPRRDFARVFAEINRIWLSQAGICFRIEAVPHDAPLPGGLDVWFLSSMGGYNGYFEGPHAIRVRDVPILGPAVNPSLDPAARTAAHELGHALGLVHRQDSDDNLMRSKTYGWALDGEEVAAARKTAAAKGVAVPTAGQCGAPSAP